MSGNYYLLTNLLSEDERRVVVSIVKHAESNSGRVGIQQIAKENYVSTAFIMKLCKRLGFDGYSELFYNLAQHSGDLAIQSRRESLENLIDNFDAKDAAAFCRLLKDFREQKLFVTGAGFADVVSDYIVQRLAVCGFMTFNRVHFYDYMIFRQERDCEIMTNIVPSMIIAISQSGESEAVLNDVEQARQKNYKVVSFSRRADSTLAKLSDISFIVDASKQTLISEVPNPFFGRVILAFEELMGLYFMSNSTEKA